MNHHQRIAVLDGLRGFSIFLVLIGHFLQFNPEFQIQNDFGGVGVLFFFVLSGYLITELLCREYEQFRKINFYAFYLRRVFRILPALLCFLIFLSFLVFFGKVTDVAWYNVIIHLLFLRNIFGRGISDAHLWSLALEEQFYLIWPFVFSWFYKFNLMKVTLGIFLTIIFWRMCGIYFQIYPYESGKFYFRSDFRMDSLLAGCLLALFFRKFKKKLSNPSSLWGFGLLFSLMLWTWFGYLNINLRFCYLTIQTFLVIGVVGSLILNQSKGISRLFNLVLFQSLGKLSYSCYLWQQLFFVTQEPNWGQVRSMPWNLLILLGISLISYFLIEKPFLVSAINRFHKK